MVWLLALIGCFHDEYAAPEPPPVVPGPPVVGAAEGYLKLPVGTPLSGFTARCRCMAGEAIAPDARQSAYNTAFIESAGVQTWPSIKVVWIENGDDVLVWTKTDSIYSFDGLVTGLEDVLTERTGRDMHGKVIHTTNHSHSSWGTYSGAITFYLGSDRYNEENFRRFRDQVADVAIEARDKAVPAKIGMGWAYDWDEGGRVYHDRRGVNNELRPWGDDSPEWVGQRDPWLGLLRFDTLDDQPIAMVVNFGMHGIVMDADSPMASGDSGLHVEMGVQEAFDEPVVVMFTQGSGGDQSPGGVQRDYAKLESLGDLAVGPIMALYDSVQTSADPIRLETASRSIPEHPSQIQVTRNGTVDWHYNPYQPGYYPDDVVYGTSGEILSPLDEFNTRVGHVFCGTGDLDLPVGKLDAGVFPYENCLDVDLLSALIQTFFLLDEMPLPLPESLKAQTAATRLGPIPVRDKDGNVAPRELLLGFFPGETTSMYVEQFKRRVLAEAGYDNAMAVGYTNDHEGYLLIPEDWLLGEYEADIFLWGPLGGEHILEGVLTMIEEVLSDDVHQDPDPLGYYARTTYPEVELPTEAPDVTPEAGTEITALPEYVWTPLDMTPELGIPAQVPRGQHVVQFMWKGGDPGIDSPHVVIERNEGGTWVPLTTRSGRTIDEGMADILLAYTPDPLAPFVVQQVHQWWLAWQAVDHTGDRMALPLGTYRLHVTGTSYTGGSTTWPWNGAPYEVFTPEFEVVPAVVDVRWDGASLTAAIPAAPEGFRLLHLDGDNHGDNPLVGPVQVAISAPSGDVDTSIDPALEGSHSRLDVAVPGDATAITVTDAHGNSGTWVP